MLAVGQPAGMLQDGPGHLLDGERWVDQGVGQFDQSVVDGQFPSVFLRHAFVLGDVDAVLDDRRQAALVVDNRKAVNLDGAGPALIIRMDMLDDNGLAGFPDQLQRAGVLAAHGRADRSGVSRHGMWQFPPGAFDGRPGSPVEPDSRPHRPHRKGSAASPAPPAEEHACVEAGPQQDGTGSGATFSFMPRASLSNCARLRHDAHGVPPNNTASTITVHPYDRAEPASNQQETAPVTRVAQCQSRIGDFPIGKPVPSRITEAANARFTDYLPLIP